MVDGAFSLAWAEKVLAYWFHELGPKDWFRKDDGIDSDITARFGGCLDQIAGTSVQTLTVDRKTALAAIIVLDQFSRNVYRGSPRAFSYDALALSLASDAVARGLDQEIRVDRRMFVYLPFEHSEDLADQDRAVELISALGNATMTQYAHAHREVIAKFGRFPHRNGVLGRTSTREEEEYLSKPGSGF